MKCKKCGAEFTEGIFCPECGTQIDVPEDSKCVDVDKKGEEISLEEAAAERKKAAEFEAQRRRQQAIIVAEQRKYEQQENLQRNGIEILEKEEQVGQQRIEYEKKEPKKEEISAQNAGKPMAIASLVLGIVSLCTFGLFVIPEILGIVFAFLSEKQGKMLGEAKAGLICSIIGIVIFIIILI